MDRATLEAERATLAAQLQTAMQQATLAMQRVQQVQGALGFCESLIAKLPPPEATS